MSEWADDKAWCEDCPEMRFEKFCDLDKRRTQGAFIWDLSRDLLYPKDDFWGEVLQISGADSSRQEDREWIAACSVMVPKMIEALKLVLTEDHINALKMALNLGAIEEPQITEANRFDHPLWPEFDRWFTELLSVGLGEFVSCLQRDVLRNNKLQIFRWYVKTMEEA